MTNNAHDDLVEFHTLMEVKMRKDHQSYLPYVEMVNASDLISEEVEELRKALAAEDIVEIGDGIVDVMYTSAGLVTRYNTDHRYPSSLTIHSYPPLPLFDIHSRAQIRQWIRQLDDAEIKLAITERWGGYEHIRSAIGMFDTAARIGYALNLPLHEIWQEVHSSNMAKSVNGKIIRDPLTQKIRKPYGWQSPDVAGILQGHCKKVAELHDHFPNGTKSGKPLFFKS